MGKRGLFTSRQGYGIPDYLQAANDETLLVVLVEDIVSVRNLESILGVDQIDVFFVAPSDLAASMGHIGNNDHPDVQRTVDETLIRIRDAGRTPGTLTTNDNVERYTDLGARFLLTTLAPWIAAGAADYLKRARG